MALAVINAIWIGPRLGPIHAACLKSFVRHGHRTRLYIYEEPSDIPEGVELVDASQLIPAEYTVRYSRNDMHKGSYALFSDFLRYEILKTGAGLYVDCDVYCLRPIEDEDYIFGYQDSGQINGAVLKLPPDSPALKNLLAIRDAKAFIPPWLSTRKQKKYRRRALLGIPKKIENMPWGIAGPEAVTWYLKKDGLHKYAKPIDVFYPVHYYQTALFSDPNISIKSLATPRTLALHLYNEMIKHLDLEDVPAGSPLEIILNS